MICDFFLYIGFNIKIICFKLYCIFIYKRNEYYTVLCMSVADLI